MLVLESFLRLLDSILPVEGGPHHLLFESSDLLLDLELIVVINCTLVGPAIALIVFRVHASVMRFRHFMFCHVIVVMSLDPQLNLFCLFVVSLQLLLALSLFLLILHFLPLLSGDDLLMALLDLPVELFSLVLKLLCLLLVIFG